MKRCVVALAAVMALACDSIQTGWQLGSEPVDEHVVTTFAGPQHCGMQDSTFLVVGWPLGQAEPSITAARWYVRNPPEFLKPELLTDYDSSVTPPADARNTGFHNSTYELWLARSDQDIAAYIKIEGHFERWPRANQSLECL